MNGFGIGDFCCRNDRRNIEIAQSGGCRANTDRFVGKLDVLGFGVRLRVHGDGLDAELTAGAQHPQGNLAPVGNQDLLEHGAQPITNSG
ncbi:hypothetical protein SDC9_153709 [bioreactor metagenome]|uniref:Uncharacterized protein n=1 Tax=bioreactor metagenome TaxID=1076179 RepID=A0A645F1C4_9ZZZZ